MNSHYTCARQGTRRETVVSGVAVPLAAIRMATPRLIFAADRFVPIRGCLRESASSKNRDRE
ncbi:MAG TPA: hypothetical protein VGM98_06890 [Schlesneria sp.]|jgi:hypothetical protein